MQLTPLSTHWAPRKKNEKVYNLFQTRCTSFHRHMVLVVHTHDEMLSLPILSSQRAWTAAAMVGDYNRQRHTTWCSWKESIEFWFHYYLPRKKR